MIIKGYTLANPEKVDRAINGSMGAGGALTGGVGSDADESVILAEYDKLGGLILKGKSKVKTGCFYDLKNSKPFAKPKVILVFHDLEGGTEEIEEGKEVPVELQAGEIRHQKRAAKKLEEATAGKKKPAKKGKAADVDEEDEEEVDEEAEDDAADDE